MFWKFATLTLILLTLIAIASKLNSSQETMLFCSDKMYFLEYTSRLSSVEESFGAESANAADYYKIIAELEKHRELLRIEMGSFKGFLSLLNFAFFGFNLSHWHELSINMGFKSKSLNSSSIYAIFIWNPKSRILEF